MIKFLDLYKINNRFRDELQLSFNKALDDSHFILGSNVSKFENEYAAFCGTKYCVGTANGLDALTLILKSFVELGKLEEGDKIIVPANTFIATILSVIHAGLQPVLVEPDSNTYNLSAATVKNHLNKDIKAIIVVHLYGQIADINSLKLLSEKHNLLLIEDAAQAHGAECEIGKAGNLSHAAAFSFYPSKNLGALGDGGAITTNDKDVANMARVLGNYGSEEKYSNKVVGYNSRLDDIQASFLSVKLKWLDKDNDRRRQIATCYLNSVTNTKIKLPQYDGSKSHVFYAFVVEVRDREDFISYLESNSMEWLIHYPVPPHKQKALQTYAHLKLTITEDIHNKIISLPMSPVLTDTEVQTVINILNRY